MLIVREGSLAPTSITLTFQSVTFGVDLSLVTAISLAVTRRDGTRATWGMTIVSATSAELVAQYAFASGDLPSTGLYYLAPSLAVPGGTVPADAVAMFVTAPSAPAPAQSTEQSVWVLETIPIPTLGPYSRQWHVTSASSSPYAAVPTTPFIAADLRAGPVVIDLWSALDGDDVVISDAYHAANLNVLTVVAAAGQTVPTSTGSQASSATYGTAGAALRLKFHAADGAWLPW